MKKLHFGIFLLVCASLMFVLTSCEQDTTEEEMFKEQLLLGHWEDSKGDNQVFEIDASKIGKRIYPNEDQNTLVYDTDHVGHQWDVSDEVKETEADVFTWKLKITGNFTKINFARMGSKIPKVYTVTVLTSEELIYNDEAGVKHVYNRK